MTDNQKAAKDYLRQVKQMDDRIRKKEEEVEELRERLILPARNYQERVQGSKRPDTFEEKMAVLLDQQFDYVEYAIEYELFRDKLFMQVLNLDVEDAIYFAILYHVYFKFMKMEDVAKVLGVSSQYLYHLHPEALRLFYDQYLSGRGNDYV